MTDLEAAPGPGPWARYGWVMGAVWLVFLGFTVYDVVNADHSWAARVVALLALAGFVAVYLHGLIRVAFRPRIRPAVAWAHLAALAMLTLPACLVAGGSGLGTLPYIAALAVFTLPLLWVLVTTVACVALPLLLPSLGVFEHGTEFQAIIPACVAAITGLVRVIDDRDERHRVTLREYEIASERSRVARDVHDVLGHSLTVLAAKAELAERVLDADPERTRDELRQIQSLTREALAEIRATVAGLRVARLGDELVSARIALAAAGIEAELPDSTDSVDPRQRLVLAWVLREAVTNVVRHSAATRCVVTFEGSGLVVVDDGRGVGEISEGNGLRGIRERIAAAGGRLEIGLGPEGRGTRLEVTL